MSPGDLLNIALFLNSKTKAFLPYSSNRTSFGYTEARIFHRLFWLHATRMRKDNAGAREHIRKFHLDISSDWVDESYQFRKVATLFNQNNEPATLQELDNYLLSLPTRNKKKQHKDGKKMAKHEFAESAAKNAVKFGIGNCGENTNLNFTLLLEYPKEGIPELNLPPVDEKILIEKITIPGCHEFVLIGRDPTSNLNDVNTWGPKATILDSWWSNFGEVFNVHDQIQNLTSSAFDLILKSQGTLTTNSKRAGYIAEGHTERWIKKRKAKSEPVNLRDWKSFFNGEKENVHWYVEQNENQLKEDQSNTNAETAPITPDYGAFQSFLCSLETQINQDANINPIASHQSTESLNDPEVNAEVIDMFNLTDQSILEILNHPWILSPMEIDQFDESNQTRFSF